MASGFRGGLVLVVCDDLSTHGLLGCVVLASLGEVTGSGTLVVTENRVDLHSVLHLIEPVDQKQSFHIEHHELLCFELPAPKRTALQPTIVRKTPDHLPHCSDLHRRQVVKLIRRYVRPGDAIGHDDSVAHSVAWRSVVVKAEFAHEVFVRDPLDFAAFFSFHEPK